MAESAWRHTGPAIRVLTVLLACLTWTANASAQDRLVRRFAAGDGLVVPPVWSLAQDSTGFIWIGAHGGLFRYDGVEFRRWAPDRIDGIVRAVAVAPDGRIAARTETGDLFRITRRGARRLASPPGGASQEYPTLAFDGDGRLWTVAAGGEPAYRVGDGDGWRTIAAERLDGRPVHTVRAAVGGGGVYLLTDSALWRVDTPADPPRERFDGAIADVDARPDGRIVLLTGDGRILELDEDGAVRELASRAVGDVPPARAISVVERNGTIWAAFDRYLSSLRPAGRLDVITPSDGFEAGGPLLVDREGSLWLGSFAALFQYPEPATTLWNDGHGLPSRHTRYLARVGDLLWVTTWQGASLIRGMGDDAVVARSPTLDERTRPCVDSTGIVWHATVDGVFRTRGDRVLDRVHSLSGFNACAPTSPGHGLWIASSRGLHFADAVRGTLTRVPATPFTGADDLVTAVLQDRDGRLWAAGHERICSAPAARVLADGGEPAGWSCDRVPGSGDVVALLELPDGDGLWAATRRRAILTRDDDASAGWRPLPENAEFVSRDVFGLVPSPSGGVWIVGHGILVRVRPRADGWDVLERPGPWNGMSTSGGADLVEDPDGTLWIATSLGVVRVPPRARFASAEAPSVVVVDARVDAEPVPLDAGLELPSDRNRLELRFAALSYRDPAAIRYQVRLGPTAPWVDTRGEASFRWVDLPAGRYDAEVRATLDGRRWSATPARFTFDVSPPWYRTGWALGLFAALAGALLWLAYRARVAFLLGLERQRTRIAMDLHDELGSGLGSVGILAGLLAGRRVDDTVRRRAAREIAESAEQLGSALADIVWSLDPRAATLEELAARLVGHGERLFVGDEVEFLVRAPAVWPDTRLPLPLRRNILMIGLEALHNAARHAGASRVTLAFARREATWTLSVADDGVGLDQGGGPWDDAPGGGRGLRGMRRRAREIDASIEWSSGSTGDRTGTGGDDAGRGTRGGTTVTLRFRLPPRRSRAAARRVRALFERLRRRGWTSPRGRRAPRCGRAGDGRREPTDR